jgi:hypothetical protein
MVTFNPTLHTRPLSLRKTKAKVCGQRLPSSALILCLSLRIQLHVLQTL